MRKIVLIIIFFNFEYASAATKIAYIDINNILNNSIVGRAITKHIKKIKEEKNKEFLITENQLLDKEKDILKKKNLLEKNDLDQQVSLLKNEVNEYNILKKNFNKDVDEKKLKNAIESTNFKNLQIIENKGQFSENVYSLKDKRKIKFFYLGPDNDWRKQLDKELINKMNKYYEGDLKKLGYEI